MHGWMEKATIDTAPDDDDDDSGRRKPRGRKREATTVEMRGKKESSRVRQRMMKQLNLRHQQNCFVCSRFMPYVEWPFIHVFLSLIALKLKAYAAKCH